MRDLLVATTNPYKKEEIAHALSGLPFNILTLKDVGLDGFDVEETEETLEGNAVLKAKEYSQRAQVLTLADDTGIFVDALDGRPGVWSARYAPTPEGRKEKLLEEMKDVPEGKRTVRFKVILAIVDPTTQATRTCSGELEGVVLREEHNGRNFGYDPIFFVSELGKTYSELSLDEKNKVSHRGKALAKVREILVAEFV